MTWQNINDNTYIQFQNMWFNFSAQLYHHFPVLYRTVLYCTLLFSTELYCTVPHCTVLYCTLLYCLVLHCTVPYRTVLYFTLRLVLHYSVLHCTVPYRTVLYCTTQYQISRAFVLNKFRTKYKKSILLPNKTQCFQNNIVLNSNSLISIKRKTFSYHLIVLLTNI